MGDAQSAQREDKKDAAAEEESGKVDDAQQNTEEKPLRNNGLISEINGKADGSLEEVNGHCEDEIAAEAILSPEDVSKTEKQLQEEEKPLKNVEINKKESPNETDVNEDVPLEMIEVDAKQNDINESFRRFFGNIGLKLTVKRGSGEIATDVPDESNKEEPNMPEDVEDTAKETTSENAEHNTDVIMAQETHDNDSTTCQTLTDATSEDVLENAEEKTTDTNEKVESDKADEATTPQNAHQDATPEKEPHSTSINSPEEEAVDSPIKRFFTTGIFSGLRKKKKPAEVETPDKELKDMTKKEDQEMAEQAVQDQDKEEISLGVEAAAVETENELKGEILAAESAQKTDAHTIDPSTMIVSEPEILNSQETDKVQASPLKRLLSGSSFKKLSKKQRGRKSSDAKLSDSGEHVSDQLLSSHESAENQKEEGGAQPSAEAPGEEESAWVSFKKLLTPKKRMKRPSLGNEEMQIPGSVEEQKPSEEGQISDASTEESKKRKDSSVSWEAVLCGSGRRRSRKTSDSEDETPQIDNDTNKQDGGSKNGKEFGLESSNEADEIIAYSPKRAGSPSESDGGSTWKSLKRLVTPKRKARDEEESKDNVHSDSEITQDESSFSIKKLLPGRKKRKSAEKQDQVSSDEADKDVASGDEDSETPAVVPMSEFDTVETEVHIQTKADVESHLPKEAEYELHQDILDQKAEPVISSDSLQTETKKAQDNESALENKALITPTANEEPDDSTESISKQQLSDIPEEATPASFTEEAARDDTIAEDLIEITSEAITAPEPLDTTIADETEMVSAVSQLSSESSKTSGNTTPVPAEYDVQETDALLHKVAETIAISPEAVQAGSNELQSERIILSDSPKTLETFVKEEQKIMDAHRRLDTTEINTDQNVEELGANNELTSTTQTESNNSVSTEIISEIPTEDFDTAEIAGDEVHELDITQPEDSLKELESIDESHNQVECLSEANVAVFTDILPEGDQIVPADVSSAETHQTKKEAQKTDSQRAESPATVADETNDGPVGQEVKSLTEKEGQIMQHITDQTQVEDKDQPPTEVAEQATTINSEEGSVQLLEKDVISEDIPAADTGTYEFKEETVPTTEVNVEAEEEDKQETDADKPVCVQVPEASEDVPSSSLDSEEGAVQSTKEEVKLEDFPLAETIKEEPKHTADSLIVSVEPENKDLPENVQETKAIVVQEPTLDSVEGSVQSLEKEAISEDIQEAETGMDESKEETKSLTEDILEPLGTTKTGHAQESKVIETVQASPLDSEQGSIQSIEKEAVPDDVPEAEAVTDEPKEESKPQTEDHLEPVDTTKTEYAHESETVGTVQAPSVDTEDGSVQSIEKEAISEDIQEAETVMDEPKVETKSLTEDILEPLGTTKTGHAQESKVIETVLLDSEDGSIQSLEKEAISEDVPGAETVMVEPKEERKPQAEVSSESVDSFKTEFVQEPEVLEGAQVSSLDSVESSVRSLEKEAMSEDVTEAETVTDEPKEETKLLTEDNLQPLDTSKTENALEPEVLQTVLSPTLDSESGSLLSLDKKVILKDIPEFKTITEVPTQETDDKPEEQQPIEACKTEHVKEPGELEAFQAPTSDLEKGGAQSLQKEDLPEVETVINVAGKETTPPTEANLEPVDASKDVSATESFTEEPKHETDVKSKEQQPVETSENEQVQEVLEAVQAPKLDLEECIVKSLEKEDISEDVQGAETVTHEVLKEKIPSTEVNLESVDTSKDVPAVETVTEESKHGVDVEQKESLSVETAKAEHVQEPKVLLSGLKNIATGTNTDERTSTYDQVVTESLQGGSAQQMLSEDILKPVVGTIITSVTDREEEVVAQLEQSLEMTDDQKTERTPRFGTEQEDCIPDVADKLPALTAVCISSVNEEASIVQVLEKPVLTETPPAKCVDHAEVKNEPKHEVHLSAIQASVETEKESDLPGKQIKTAADEYAVVAQIVTCNLKEIAAAIPDILIEKTSAITERLIDSVANEQTLKEEVESAKPIMKDEVAETAEASSVMHFMMHVPSVEFEDNHRIQVQGADVDIKPAETTVDTVLEAGVTEDKEVIDVCQEKIKKVDATAEIEDKLINDENKVVIQEVIQHVKENIPQPVPESMVVSLEQEGIKQTDAVNETVEKQSIEVEDQKVMENNTTIFMEKQDEAPSVISDVSETEQVSEDLKKTPDIPRSSDLPSHDHQEDLEETKASQVKSEAAITAEDSGVKKIEEEVQIPPVSQSQTLTPSNNGIVATQNTGIISSIGNVETPSSLSFEFKFNIQFGQAKATASQPSTTEKTEPVKKTDVSEVGVQAVEVEETIRPTQQVETQKQSELTEVTVQSTEITDPAKELDSTEITDPVKELDSTEITDPVKELDSTEITDPAKGLDSTEIVAITTQPVLLGVGIQAMEIIESAEQIKSTKSAPLSVQASEIIQPVRSTENREVILSQPVLSQCCDQETKAEEPVKQKDEENDQDVWMDAAEDINTQEEIEVSHHEVKEFIEPQADSAQEETAGSDHEVQMAANSKPKEEESQPDSEIAVTCENDSDSEDFAVALEDLEIATASVGTLE